MSDRVFQVGILGAGYIADWHAKAMKHVPGARISAVCDLAKPRAEAFAQAWGVPKAYGSIAEMLAGDKPDAVHVLLPPQFHASAAKELLNAGVHVLLEKPMAIDERDCRELVELADAKGLKLGVSHNFLFSRPYARLRHDVKSGRLGRIDHVSITWAKELPFMRVGPFEHWAVREPGNAILEVGVHSVAHLVDLLGVPNELRVDVSRPTELPTGVTAYRRWQVDAHVGDVAAELLFSLGPGYTEHAIHVRGTLGVATCDFETNSYVLKRGTPYAMDIDRFVTTRGMGSRLKRAAWRNLTHYALSKAKLSGEGNAFGYSIAESLRAFYGSLRSGKVDCRISGATGADVVKVARHIADGAPRGEAEAKPAKPQATPGASGARVLVTGGTGFIGRELVKQLLARGERVRIMTRRSGIPAGFDFDTSKLEVMTGNILTDADQDRALEGIEVVYHLARGDGKTYADYLKSDVEPTRKLAEKCVARGVKRLIYTSSIVVFNWADNGRVIRDDSPIDRAVHRRAAYTRAKADAERVLLQLHHGRGLPVVIFRPGIVVGPGSDPRHWGVGMWSEAGVPGVVQVWGGGDNPLPFVLVEDVAKGMIAAQDKPEAVGKTFNLVDDPMLSARDYLAEFERAAKVEIDKRFVPPWRFYAGEWAKYVVKVAVRHPGRTLPSYRDWNARRELSTYDTTLTRQVLGWQPTANREVLVERGIRLPTEELFR